MPNGSVLLDHFFDLLLLQIISSVENDVVLEDMFERTTTANSNASIEEEIDDGRDNITGNSIFSITIFYFTSRIINTQGLKNTNLAVLQTIPASISGFGTSKVTPNLCFPVKVKLDLSFLPASE